MNTCFGYAYYVNNFIKTSKKKENIDMYKVMYVCMHIPAYIIIIFLDFRMQLSFCLFFFYV